MKLTDISTRYIVAAAMAAMALGASAQETYSGYFAEGYEYRFRMNPAFGNDAATANNFVSFPGLSDLNVAMRGNLHLTNIFYNVDGRTSLFTNPNVSAQEVMGNIKDMNKLGADLNVTLLAGGFKAWGGYNTVSINARANAGVALPKGIFSLLKEGVTNRDYDISDMNVSANAFAEIALGHSRDINSKWRLGGALKFYLGVANVDATLDRALLNLGTENWNVQSQASLHSSGLKIKSKLDDNGRNVIDGFDAEGMGVNGFGIGVDLGAVFTPNADWQFSAAVLDLGFISWNNDYLASTDGVKEFDLNNHTFDFNDTSKSWDDIKESLEELYNVEYEGDQGGRTTMPGVTLNFAARYTLPLYRKLTFGLVNTTTIRGRYTFTDFRLSANVAPVKMLSASANLAVGTYGVGFGWLLNYHYTGFGLFLGMDHTMGKLAKQGIPLNSNASLNFGMNFLF